MEIIQSAEFWMAMSAVIGLAMLFVPPPYRPILAIIAKIIEAMPKKKAETRFKENTKG